MENASDVVKTMIATVDAITKLDGYCSQLTVAERRLSAAKDRSVEQVAEAIPVLEEADRFLNTLEPAERANMNSRPDTPIDAIESTMLALFGHVALWGIEALETTYDGWECLYGLK